MEKNIDAMKKNKDYENKNRRIEHLSRVQTYWKKQRSGVQPSERLAS